MTKPELEQLNDFLKAVLPKISDDTDLLVLYGHANNIVKRDLRDWELRNDEK